MDYYLYLLFNEGESSAIMSKVAALGTGCIGAAFLLAIIHFSRR